MIMYKILRNVPQEAIPLCALISGVVLSGTALGLRNTREELYNQYRMKHLEDKSKDKSKQEH